MKIEVKKEKMTKSVIKQIIEIDKQFYFDFDYSNPAWYYQRYNENNEITTLRVGGKIVGYYLFFDITHHLLTEILNLKYSGDYDFPDDQVNQQTGIAYLPSVLVMAEYRTHSLPLLKQLLIDFNAKKEVVAIAVSAEGKRMCKRFMTYIGSPKKDVEIYYKGSHNE